MKKIILLTSLATIAITSVGTINNAKAEPNSGVYSQQPQHQQNRRHARRDNNYDHLTRRERRQHRNRHNDHFSYGGGISYSSHYGYNQNRRHHRGNNIALGVGLGMLTYQLINSRQSSHNHTYVERQPARQPVVYVERQPAQTSCLQEREYQTTVIIGGVEHGAYGTACLQPDGNWKQGPAIVEPQF